ncbi:succinylglutamate desuccinylase/aspartoacylase family protein [Croceitalea vernalis]|uniref:Succinylglutamate desuccinylase/aspartoacylase family protein n=1 Tax=Croceitalea vernalis TaxID=3075599 RepID=A0ABU3BI90_9FLAO|nr:succinylglutamate desuccinylase/aspartoacylase family protein [Croceitalea sp. P007]MDT0621882.1 succinylglutamate desuccinylase/aspartoacylase family protein [Croceitalea sp. P007]
MFKNLTIFLIIFSTSLGFAQDDFQSIVENQTRPSVSNIRIKFSDSQNNQGHLPISIIKGKKEGPTFTIVAGVHGYEYPPIIATQEFLKEIDIDRLSGTLIVVPIANTGSFFSRTPLMNPQDKVNLNGALPGKSNGSITYKIADYFKTKIIPLSDVFLDIHGGGAAEDLMPFICYYRNKKRPEQTLKAKQLSETSGFEYVVSYAYTLKDDEPAKYVFKQAAQDGKIALSIESGKLGNVQKDAVVLIKRGVYSMLNQMEMYNSDIEPLNSIIKLNNQTYIRSNNKGIFYSKYKAGDTVKEGDIVGQITDEFGVVISEFKAPVSGIILYKISTPPINIDDTIMCISNRI